MKRLLALSMSVLALLACSNPAPVHAPHNQHSVLRQLTVQGPNVALEQRVQDERLITYLGKLSGHLAVGTQGQAITERGTRQGREQTRAYLSQTLEQLGYTVERQDYRRNGSNIYVRLMADTPTDEYIVLGAHLDSVRNPGADDNATGSAAVLEAATVLPTLKNRRVNIILAWFDEEEIGLVGSREMANLFRQQGLKISSMHNIDMLGWDGDKDQAIEVAQPDGILWDYYNMVNQRHGFNLPLQRSNTGQSDHESFHRAGFDAVCLSEEYTSRDMTPHYHRRGDVFGTIHQAYFTHSTRFIVAVIGDLVQGVPAPIQIQSVPNDRFPSRPRHVHASYDEAAHNL